MSGRSLAVVASVSVYADAASRQVCSASDVFDGSCSATSAAYMLFWLSLRTHDS